MNSYRFPLTNENIVSFLNEYKISNKKEKENIRNKIIELSGEKNFTFLRLDKPISEDVFLRVKKIKYMKYGNITFNKKPIHFYL